MWFLVTLEELKKGFLSGVLSPGLDFFFENNHVSQVKFITIEMCSIEKAWTRVHSLRFWENFLGGTSKIQSNPNCRSNMIRSWSIFFFFLLDYSHFSTLSYFKIFMSYPFDYIIALLSNINDSCINLLSLVSLYYIILYYIKSS